MKEAPPDLVADALRSEIRKRLPDLSMPAAQAAEVVEELTQLLADAATEHPAEADLDPEAIDFDARCRRWVGSQVPDFEQLARDVMTNRRGVLTAHRWIDRPQETREMSPERTRASNPTEWLLAFFRDLRFACRMLAKKPLFTAVAVLTIGLGVGVNASVFSVVDALLLRPVPAESPEELVNVYTIDESGSFYYSVTSLVDVESFRGKTETLESLEAYAMTVLALDNGASRLAIGAQVTEGWFSMLGLEPAVGRFFDSQEADADVVVLGHETWLSEFGGDPDVVGRSVRVQGSPCTIVGVVPDGFRGFFQGLAPEVWLPIRTGRRLGAGAMQSGGRRTDGLDAVDDPAYRWVWPVGRKADGVSQEQVEAEFETLAAAASAEHPESHEGRRFVFVPTRDVRLVPEVDGPMRLAGWIALAVASLVLLIACANLANMLLARAIGRRKEIATRLSLGAGRGQVLRQLLTESLMLAAAGGIAGLVFAGMASRWLASPDLPSPVPLDLAIGLDQRVLGFVAAVTLVTCVGFGLWPALASLRLDLSNTLREEGRGGGGRRKGGLRSALVVAQVALSFVLLASAGLMLRSLEASRDANLGFDTDNVVVATFVPSFQGLDDERMQDFFDRLERQLDAQPGATATIEVGYLPLGFEWNNVEGIAFENRTIDVEEWPRCGLNYASPGYFEVLGISLLGGRGFEETDDAESERVAVLNETAAKTFWPGLTPAEAVGRRVQLIEAGELEVTVVGIVADGKYRSLNEDPMSHLWLPIRQQPQPIRRVLVAYEGSAEPIMAGIRRASRSIDERVGPIEVTTLEDAMDSALFVARTGSSLLGSIALLGLMLSSIGLYGVLAQAVGERRHEMGVRMALGADRWAVLRMVLRDGLMLVGLGAALGLAGALAVGRALSSFLYGIGAADPATFVGVLGVLTLVALAACWVPASRASRVDPSTALRWD
ncbi:MAG: ABC transporter permease [Thermoanaerobaculia bacterium]|nr:ABC transporter permease [Thermoanaerobaculia bacterium]